MKYNLFFLLFKINFVNCIANITEFSVPDRIKSGDCFYVNCSYFIKKDSLIYLELSKDEKSFYIYYPTGLSLIFG